MYGARLMLSAPPPTAMSVSPSMMVCAAETIACRPEPHSRFKVSAGVSFATPAFIAATRARYMSFGSVWITLPKTTCPTSSPATRARANASCPTCARSWVAPPPLRPPPKSPTAVRTPDTMTTSRCVFMSVLPHNRIAQCADAADLDLADIAVLHVLGGALGAHPQHVAGIQRQVLRHRHQEVDHAEYHMVGLERDQLLAVQPHLGDQVVQLHVGLDPRAHGLERVAIFGAPQRAVALLPGPLAPVVADREAKYCGQRVVAGQVFAFAADHRDEFAFVLHLVGGVLRDDDRFVVCDQRIVGPIPRIRLLRQFHLQAD